MQKKIFLFILLILRFKTIFAIEDDLKKSINMLISANTVQLERIKVATENLTNIDSVATKKGSMPYRRKIVLVKNTFNKRKKMNQLLVKNITYSKAAFNFKYDPNHPFAQENGYLAYPNVTLEIEKADIMEAQRSYEANLSVIEISNSLINKTIESINK